MDHEMESDDGTRQEFGPDAEPTEVHVLRSTIPNDQIEVITFDDSTENITNAAVEGSQRTNTGINSDQPRVSKVGGKWKCVKCDKVFTRNNTAHRHFRTRHEQRQRYTCDKCDYSTDRRHMLTRHKCREAPRPAITFCFVCKKQFNSVRSLQRHVKHAKEHAAALAGDSRRQRAKILKRKAIKSRRLSKLFDEEGLYVPEVQEGCPPALKREIMENWNNIR